MLSDDQKFLIGLLFQGEQKRPGGEPELDIHSYPFIPTPLQLHIYTCKYVVYNIYLYSYNR
jgi:hypothetical protein